MTAFDSYLAALTRLHLAAGAPTSRRISTLSAEPVSHTTVNDVLKGRQCKWSTIARVVITLAAQAQLPDAPGQIYDLWARAQMEQDQDDTQDIVAGLKVVLQEIRDLRALVERLVD